MKTFLFYTRCFNSIRENNKLRVQIKQWKNVHDKIGLLRIIAKIFKNIKIEQSGLEDPGKEREKIFLVIVSLQLTDERSQISISTKHQRLQGLVRHRIVPLYPRPILVAFFVLIFQTPEEPFLRLRNP